MILARSTPAPVKTIEAHQASSRHGRQPWLPWRHLLTLCRDQPRALQELARDYGDVVTLGPRWQRFYLLSHPDHVRQVLVTRQRDFLKRRGLKRLLRHSVMTADGDVHRARRRAVLPAFHHDRIQEYARTISEHAEQACERWRHGELIDVGGEMRRLALGIAGDVLFDADLSAGPLEIEGACSSLVDYQNPFSLAALRSKLPLSRPRRLTRALRRVDEALGELIARRRAGGVERNDVLSMLLAAGAGEEAGTAGPAEGACATGGDRSGARDRQVRDEMLTLLLAAYETTSTALTWTWLLLARHPEVEAELHRVVDRIPGAGPPADADRKCLQYVEDVFAEALRLYPPVWLLMRLANRDCDLGGVRIEGGARVLISPFVVHRDERHFPQPARFDPRRWTPEARAARPDFAYIPFASGAHGCVGEGLAWLEAVLVIATVARRWRLRLAPGQRAGYRPGIVLRPEPGLRMRVERRGS